MTSDQLWNLRPVAEYSPKLAINLCLHPKAERRRAAARLQDLRNDWQLLPFGSVVWLPTQTDTLEMGTQQLLQQSLIFPIVNPEIKERFVLRWFTIVFCDLENPPNPDLAGGATTQRFCYGITLRRNIQQLR